MMETTIEQKREAVLAECTLLFKDTVPGQVVVVSPGVSLQTGYIRDMFGPMHDHYACIDLRIAGNPCASLWEKSKDWEIDLFWRLLGLETRAAVNAAVRQAIIDTNLQANEAMKQKDLTFIEILKGEKAKTAALVVALEKTKTAENELRANLSEHWENHKLKTDADILDMVGEFGFGECEFHTADIQRLAVKSIIVDKAIEAHRKGEGV